MLGRQARALNKKKLNRPTTPTPPPKKHNKHNSGHALLVGVGGSGKQSLARLAAPLVGADVVTIAVSATYGLPEFKEALLGLFARAGAKGQKVVFLLTDNQVCVGVLVVCSCCVSCAACCGSNSPLPLPHYKHHPQTQQNKNTP